MNRAKPIAELASLLKDYPGLVESLAGARMERAHKFVVDVDTLPYDLFRAADDYAIQLAEFGLLTLPFPECAFVIGPYVEEEYTNGHPHKEFQYVIVAWMDGDTIHWRVYHYFPADGAATTMHATFHIPRTMGWIEWSRGFDGDRKTFPGHQVTLDDNPTGQHRYLQHGGTPGAVDHGTPGEYQMTAGGLSSMLLYSALGCLNARGVVAPQRKAPTFLNRQRARKGKLPIFSYQFVTVDPTLLRMPGLRAGGTHASPRLHWRRAHPRKLPDGRRVLIKACLVGDPDRGFIHHDYRVRTGMGARV